MLFMLCTFGYMIFLIVFKFCVDWSSSARAAPNLVQTMIAMFLAPGSVDEDKILYEGQAAVQFVLLVVALLAVPVMLLGQPLVARAQHNKLFPNQPSPKRHAHRPQHHASNYQSVPADGSEDDEGGDSADEDDFLEEGKQEASSSTAAAAAAPAAESAGAHGADPTSPHYNFSDHAITQGQLEETTTTNGE